MDRLPNTQYVLSLSYGKDSIACLFAIEELGLPLDRIVHAEVWATDTIPADLPPMVEFKKKADKIIKDRWGIEVEHICAMQKAREPEDESEGDSRWTYERMFYHEIVSGKYQGAIKGFPCTTNGWCKHLKYSYGNDVQSYVRKTVLQSNQRDAVEDTNRKIRGGGRNLWISNRKLPMVQRAQTYGASRLFSHRGAPAASNARVFK